MKRILGLDLGTTSIGWADVIEGKNANESEIVQIGVRVNPLTTDEQLDFEKGKTITTNAARTEKRGARRNLDRYQLRRDRLINILKDEKIITDDTILNNENEERHEIWEKRAKAVTEKIELEDFARILLSINKKRGYKSSRKAKNEDEGQIIDGMAVAKELHDKNLTPGKYVYLRLKEGAKAIPDFYRSDLQAEFDTIWEVQKEHYPELLTDNFYENLKNKGKRATSAAFYNTYNFNTADNKGNNKELITPKTHKFTKNDLKKLQAYQWRTEVLTQKMDKEVVAYVLTEINNQINQSSGYLGEISDRSKELYFHDLTVGQYLYQQLEKNTHTSLKNQVFYRQDYMDEFDAIWETQAKYYDILTQDLKTEIGEKTIFYQRPLKSQKGLISFCEIESKEVEVIDKKTGKKKKKIIGSRVAPKSSLIVQEFKIWQRLHDLEFIHKEDKSQSFKLSQEDKEYLFQELNVKGNLRANQILKIFKLKSKEWKLNFEEVDGNRTNRALYNAYLKILEIEGYNEDLLKLSNKDKIDVSDLTTPAEDIKEMVKIIFKELGINTDILDFNPEKGEITEQASYLLWHLIYSAEDDNKNYSDEDILKYGNSAIRLKKNLCEKFGFKPEHTKILANIIFQDDYGSLSLKALRNIHPYIKENQYSTACELAGYRHSKHSLTKEEIEQKELEDKLELLPKNSLRNPVVEKIINQMINVVNALIDKENDKLAAQGKERNFHFDEIRIEMARELKASAKERESMTTGINKAKNLHQSIRKTLQTEFGVPNPTRNDIIRYKLYEELKDNGYKDLYRNNYIPKEKLFSSEIDIEHIIPKARLFDDSFSNKTLTYRNENLKKGNRTAYDYILEEYGQKELEKYVSRVEDLKNKISTAKYKKFLKKETEIGEGFIERDLRETQYITKKSKELLSKITKSVVVTTGKITDRLREDWGLIAIMKELNLPKYRALGMTEEQERKNKKFVEVIQDWSKRNDHRHHAMDALTIAFTKRSYIQYLNNLNARRGDVNNADKNKPLETAYLRIATKDVAGIENKELERNEKGKLQFKKPIPDFRKIAKEHLESIIISHKAKNKVVTNNINKYLTKTGVKTKLQQTPRGQLHKETVYKKYRYYEQKTETIGSKFDIEMIEKVANKTYKKLLLQRLEENENNPKKAFTGNNSLSKKPIYLDAEKTVELPKKVKTVWLEDNFSIRKPVNPDTFKNKKDLEKVIDVGVRKILLERLEKFDNDAKAAFSNLEKKPIWLNEEHGIAIKNVTITGVRNAEPLHAKRDHFGNIIYDKKGNEIPTDFVSTGNNHHVAVYRDEKGNLQENVISFFEAVARANMDLPIIDKTFNQDKGWQFLFSMKQNEMFVFPNEKTNFNPKEVDLLDPNNKKTISPNLFRVQKFSKVIYGNSAVRDYCFRHHLETTVDDIKELKDVTYKSIKSLKHINNIVKVRTNHLGDIVQVGEY